MKAGSSAGGGFSADLAKELGSGSAAKTGGDASKAGAAAGSGTAAVTVGSDALPAGSEAAKQAAGAAKVDDPAAAKSEAAKAGGGAAKADDPAAAKSEAAKAGGGAAKADDPAVAKSEAAKSEVAKPGGAAKPGDAAKPGGPAAGRSGGAKPEPIAKPGGAPEPHGPVKVPADLAAIKLSLLPNWDRDVDEAGTFQYVVRIKGTQSTKTFSFRYGYDDPRAPTDREQYKKYLHDSTVLMGEIKDRQRGSAWFLEGADASGHPAFRYVVLYGGKRLICYGSLYKDADANRLGDDRDQTVIQAKQICETLAL